MKMTLKKINLALFVLLLILVSIALTVTLLYLRIFPLYDPLTFIPNSVLGYVHLTNISTGMKDAQLAILLNQLAKLPIWKNLRMSDIGSVINSPVELDRLVRLINGEIVIALFKEDDKIEYLAVVPVKMSLRLLYSFPLISKIIQTKFQTGHDNYETIRIKKLESPQNNIYYTMVGRIGLVSESDLPIKRAIDAYKGAVDHVISDPRLKDLSSNLFPADVSFFLNLNRVGKLLADRTYKTGTSKSDLTSTPDRIAVGKLYLMNDRLHIEVCFDSLPRLPIVREENRDNIILPLSEDTILLLMHKQIDPSVIINYLGSYKVPFVSLILKKLRLIASNFLGEAFIRYDNMKFQIIPPVLFFIKVRDKNIAHAVLRDMEREMKQLYPSINVEELVLKNGKIGFIDPIPGVLFPMSLAYSILDNGLLVVSNSLSSLGAVVDISSGERRSSFDDLLLIKDLESASDISVSAKPKELLPILDKLIMLYLFERKIQGKKLNDGLVRGILNSFSAFRGWNLLNLSYKCNGDRSILRILLR